MKIGVSFGIHRLAGPRVQRLSRLVNIKSKSGFRVKVQGLGFRVLILPALRNNILLHSFGLKHHGNHRFGV